jgi:hypothetical protein
MKLDDIKFNTGIRFQLDRQARSDIYQLTGEVRAADGFLQVQSVARFELGVVKEGYRRRISVPEFEWIRPGRGIKIITEQP